MTPSRISLSPLSAVVPSFANEAQQQADRQTDIPPESPSGVTIARPGSPVSMQKSFAQRHVLSIKREFLNMLDKLFDHPGTGTAPQPMPEAWIMVRALDKQRRIDKNVDLSDMVERLRESAHDKHHPLNRDAVLLRKILARPMGKDAPALEDYLVQTVYPKFDFGAPYDKDQWTNAPLRDIKRNVSLIALEAQFYTAAGRALLLKSLMHMTGISTHDGDLVVKPKEELDLYNIGDVLQFVISAFPKIAEDDEAVIKTEEFDNPFDPDPLERRGFHYNS